MALQSSLTFKEKLNKIAEIGWQEKQTTSFIRKALKVDPLVAGFGKEKVGLLYRLGHGKKTILLRADIDALKNGEKVDHICGHSTHTAALMSTFLNTQKYTQELNRQNKAIYFLFQPAEETFPSGAKAVLKEYFNSSQLPSFAFAAHVRPLEKKNVIYLQAGAIMAGGDYLEVEFVGEKKHVKNCLDSKDAIYGASYFVNLAKKFQSENRELRFNFGVIAGGEQANAVAPFAIIKGDIRIKNSKDYLRVKKFLWEAKRLTETQTKVKVKLNYYTGYPLLANNSLLTKKITEYFDKEQSFEMVNKDGAFSYGCEDFAFFAQKVPSVYALIGTGDKNDIHTTNCMVSDAGTLSVEKYFLGVVDWFISSSAST
jgi:amidohydrolase